MRLPLAGAVSARTAFCVSFTGAFWPPFCVRTVSARTGIHCRRLSSSVSEASSYVAEISEENHNQFEPVSAAIIRCADSGSAYRGSNPWGAAIISVCIHQGFSATFPKTEQTEDSIRVLLLGTITSHP